MSATADYNVLLIEKNPQETEIYSDLLREVASCQVDVVSRVESSIDWLTRGNYHLVVLDTGAIVVENDNARSRATLDLLEKIRSASPNTTTVVISDHASVEEAVGVIRLGAEDYLQKPFNPDRFKLAVKRSLDRKAVFAGNVNASAFLNLIHSCQMISSALEQEKVFSIVQSYFARELSAPNTQIYSVQSGEVKLVQTGMTPDQKDQAIEEILDIALKASRALELLSKSEDSHRFIERTTLYPSLFVFRFRGADPCDYFCVSLSPRLPEDYAAFESRLRMLRSQIELTGKNIEQYRGMSHLAYVDDVTGLYNTRYLSFILEREIKQAKANQTSFAVLFIDADRFKDINDENGHLIGTKLLNELGRQLRKYVRDSDTVFRYGGDEFIAVLSPSDLEGAAMVAERIRASVQKRPFLAREGLNIHFTVSIGVAVFPTHADTREEIVEMADQAMYNAKRKSRNCVFLASELLSEGDSPVPLPKSEKGKKAAKKGAQQQQGVPKRVSKRSASH